MGDEALWADLRRCAESSFTSRRELCIISEDLDEMVGKL